LLNAGIPLADIVQRNERSSGLLADVLRASASIEFVRANASTLEQLVKTKDSVPATKEIAETQKKEESKRSNRADIDPIVIKLRSIMEHPLPAKVDLSPPDHAAKNRQRLKLAAFVALSRIPELVTLESVMNLRSTIESDEWTYLILEL